MKIHNQDKAGKRVYDGPAMGTLICTPDMEKVRSGMSKTTKAVKYISLLLGLAFGQTAILLPAQAQNSKFTASSARGDIPVFAENYDGAEFCASGTIDAPCDVAPVDVPEFDASFVYRFLAYHAQRPFDRFSWQGFTALMTPLDKPDQPALWESFPTRRDLFSEVPYPNPTCADDLPEGTLLLASYLQTTGDALVDQAGNFVLFETRINPVAARYIQDNDLDQKTGRAAFAKSGNAIEFPKGKLFDPASTTLARVEPAKVGQPADAKDSVIPPSAPGDMGAQLLKFAWRVLPDGANAVSPSGQGYYTRPARISLGMDQTLDGKPHCLDVTVALVGLHLVQRVASGNGDRWIWSSFEHVNNVPLAANARRPNSIITDNPFADGCLPPDIQEEDQAYAFYGHQTQKGMAANQPTRGNVKWADQQPFARMASGEPVKGPDIVRCWRLFSGTAEANFIWQRKLEGTVWQNYMLLGTQWIGNPGGATFGVGEVPRYLTNSTLESFMQDQADATCLGCHTRARTDSGQVSNFTFLLDPPS
ncbi:hypothetical protein ACTU44_03320 [Thalassospira sp. SM2505]